MCWFSSSSGLTVTSRSVIQSAYGSVDRSPHKLRPGLRFSGHHSLGDILSSRILEDVEETESPRGFAAACLSTHNKRSGNFSSSVSCRFFIQSSQKELRNQVHPCVWIPCVWYPNPWKGVNLQVNLAGFGIT